MAKRGGLGRGLDALIPAKKAEKAQKKKKVNEESQRETAVSMNESKKSTSGQASKTSKKSTSTVKGASSAAKRTTKKANDAISPEVKQMAEEIISGSSIAAEGNEDTLSTVATEDMLNEKLISEERAPLESGEVAQDELTSDHNTAGNAETKEAAAEVEMNDKNIVNLRISLVEPNRGQPRKYFDDQAIEELADSIRQFGIISPLLVQKKADYFEIIAGERRWRAAKKVGLKEIPVIIRDFSDQEAVEVSLIENIQREDLNPIEEAKAYNRLVSEYGLNQEEVAGRVSKSRSAVANSMRLLKLADEIQKQVETGELSEGHARALIPLVSPELQRAVVDQIKKDRLSVRQTEKVVRDLLQPGVKKEKKKDERRDALLVSLSENLKSALGTKVSIRQSGRNKGRIEIEYYSDDELDRLYELLRSVR